MWTWNAIGKAAGAWNLAADANESRQGFLLNHLISEELPARSMAHRAVSNSDPITGQAGWYDVRVRVVKADDQASAAQPAAVRAAAPRTRAWPSGPAGWRRSGRTLRSTGEVRMSKVQLALVIDLNVCVGCHACVTSCKEWNTSGAAGPLTDDNPYGADPNGTFFNRVQTFEVGEYPAHRDGALPEVLPALRRPALRAGVPDRRLATSARKTASCWSTTTSASAASTAPGPAPTARASSTSSRR